MDARDDVASILPYLPVCVRSYSFFWPPKAFESIKALSFGPQVSGVRSGEVFFDAILDLRDSLSISPTNSLAPAAARGYALFFDELMPRADAERWFDRVLPALAGILLSLPKLLEDHYTIADCGQQKTGLRILASGEAGIVFLKQDLIAALLACALFCLFPTSGRGKNDLPHINFDNLFAGLSHRLRRSQEQKIVCLIHYFERISSSIPANLVSFQRKVLPLGKASSGVSYPDFTLWKSSNTSLCLFEVSHTGSIEDAKREALEVDFANEYLGGGALGRGCVQEEIRFMVNPELIAGMLFMPSMGDNEAIVIVGSERFSCYSGYASTFQFDGNFEDKTPIDSFGRRRTHIVAIDALCYPGIRQYYIDYLLREANKAFCGFLDCQDAQKEGTYTNVIGIATGNWGCGAFGGDPVLKSMLQWLAASQAQRPFLLYYTFGEASLSRLEETTKWILEHEWSVGELWSMLVKYSSLRLNGNTRDNFFDWLLPAMPGDASADGDMSE